jgi:hypothetical protein
VTAPLEVVGAPPVALASNDLGKVGVGRSTEVLEFLRELVGIRLILVLLSLLLAIALSRGLFGCASIGMLSKLVEALPNCLDLCLKSYDLIVDLGLLVGIGLLDAVCPSA